jgi:hypothetical protein
MHRSRNSLNKIDEIAGVRVNTVGWPVCTPSTPSVISLGIGYRSVLVPDDLPVRLPHPKIGEATVKEEDHGSFDLVIAILKLRFPHFHGKNWGGFCELVVSGPRWGNHRSSFKMVVVTV